MSLPTKQTNLSGGFIDGIKGVLNDYVFNSPLNTCLSLLIAFFVYRLIKSRRNRRRSGDYSNNNTNLVSPTWCYIDLVLHKPGVAVAFNFNF